MTIAIGMPIRMSRAEQQHAADHVPQQRPPERADQPREVRRDPCAARVVALHVRDDHPTMPISVRSGATTAMPWPRCRRRRRSRTARTTARVALTGALPGRIRCHRHLGRKVGHRGAPVSKARRTSAPVARILGYRSRPSIVAPKKTAGPRPAAVMQRTGAGGVDAAGWPRSRSSIRSRSGARGSTTPIRRTAR